MDRVLGIDLGTTNSVVAYYEQGQPVVIPNSEGAKTTPSVVFYKSASEIIVGELAKRNFVTHPSQCIRSVKRFMGARFSEVADRTKGLGYDLAEGPDGGVLIDVGWTRVTPEMVSAEILKKMRSTAQDFFGEQVTKAVVTVPAYFNDQQRSATKYAGELAGLDVVRIVNEPTAAALAYGINKQIDQKVAVFDLGGGTFDVSILELSKDVFEVRSTNGDTFLGGDNIDELLLSHYLAKFQDETGVDLAADLQAFQRVREAVEKMKCELSSTTQSMMSLPFVGAGPSGPVHLNESLDRAAFDNLISELIPSLTQCCQSALDDAGMRAKDIEAVLLVGGSTRIPMVQNTVREYFGREPNRTLNPDEAVAIGAAIQGAVMTGGLREVLLLDVTPLSLGIELAGSLFGALIPRNSSIPTVANKVFTTNRENQETVLVHVLQGERKKATENHTLARFKLKGIAPAPAGIPAINVCFQIDANGILNVSATDATSGASHSISIESYAGYSPEAAEEVVKKAEEAADQDRTFMRTAYIRGQVDAVLLQLNQEMENDAGCLDADFVKTLRETIFRFDLSVTKGESNDAIDRVFNEVKTLHNDMAGRLVQHAARKTKF